MQKNSKIFVAGSDTFLGGALVSFLERENYTNIVGTGGDKPELTDQTQVESFFKKNTPEYVFLVGGKSGGIAFNQKYPAELMLENLRIECNCLESSFLHGVKKLLYLASSCVYPAKCPQPMEVISLLTGPPEPTNEAYAIAKIAGIKLCQSYRREYRMNFISAIPSATYGPGDNFSTEDSHVVAGLIRRMHDAKVSKEKRVQIWGTGLSIRDFIYVDDLAEACIFIMENYDSDEPINLGSGSGISIKELAAKIKKVTGFTGKLAYDRTKPDGMLEKVLDTSSLKSMGWSPKVALDEGLAQTYKWFLKEEGQLPFSQNEKGY